MTYAGIESVQMGDSAKAVKACFDVHFPEAKSVADLTYGKGRFWLLPYERTPDVIGLDIDTSGGAEIRSDYRHVPLKDQSVDVAVLDPPFIFSRGIQRTIGEERGFRGEGGGLPRNPEELAEQTWAAVKEMLRVARRGMILKGMDLVTGKHVDWWSARTIADMRPIIYGWNSMHGTDIHPEPADMLIQVSKKARMVDPRWKRQLHFRRRHVIYLVYTW